MKRGEIDTNKFDVFMAAEFARSANFFDSTLRYLPHQSDGISESVGNCQNLLESAGTYWNLSGKKESLPIGPGSS